MCESLCDKKNEYEYYLNYRLVDCLNEKSRSDSDKNGDIFANMYDEYKVVLIYKHQKGKNNEDQVKKKKEPEKIVLKSRRKYFLSYDIYMDFDFKTKSIADQLKFLAHHFKVTFR